MLSNLNKDSIVARISNEQFCVLLQNRPYAEIYQIFTEIGEKVKLSQIPIHVGFLRFTISVGASISKDGTFADMIDDADEALAQVVFKGGDAILISS